MKLRSRLSKLINILFSIILLLSFLYFSYTIYLYKGIETFYRIMLLLLCLNINLAIIFSLHFSNKKMQKKRHKISLISAVIFSIIYIVLAIIINNIYNKLDSMNKDKITYTTKLISFKKEDIKNLKNKKIGILDNEEDIEYYILPNEVIKKYKLNDNNEIIKYSSNVELIDSLYEKEVDLIFVADSYADIFSTFDEYSDIEEKAIEINSYEKEYKKEETEENQKQVAKLTEPFSILLLGIDSTEETLAKNSSFNGDTMILATFNPNTMSATMVSFPRDIMVKVACNGKMQKINTSTWCGTNGAIKTIESLTDIDIDYYVKINFKGLVNLVDELGGIDVEVPYSFCEQNSSRKWGNNTVYVKKGKQHLNGEQALALSRNRHYPSDGSKVGKQMAKYCPNDKDGKRNDFTRNSNQQLVIKGIIEAAKNIDSLSKVNDILDTISKSIDTNMKVDQMLSGYELIKSVALNKNANMINIQKTKLKTYSVGKSGHMIYDPSTKRYTSVAFYYKESLKDITDAMKIDLGIKKPKLIKSFEFDINKEYEQEVIGDKKYSETKVQLVPNFLGKTVHDIKSFANKNKLDLKFIDSETNKEVNIDSYDNYTFLYQNEKEYTPVFKIDSITIYVKPKATTIPVVNPSPTNNNIDNSNQNSSSTDTSNTNDDATNNSENKPQEENPQEEQNGNE